MKDEYVSVEHLVLGMMDQPNAAVKEVLRQFGVDKQRFLQALAAVRGNQRVTSDNPESTYDVLNKYGQELVSLARPAKAGPGDWPRRRNSQCNAHSQPENEEQPCADWRAGRGQNSHCRGAGTAHVRGDVPENLKNRKVFSP